MIRNVYYCRAMDGLPFDEIYDEYKYIERILQQLSINLINTDSVVSTKALEFTKANSRKIVNANLEDIKRSDLVLVNFSIINHDYVGCIGEMIYAKKMNKTVIAICGDNNIANHFWTLYHTDHITKTLNEALKILEEM